MKLAGKIQKNSVRLSTLGLGVALLAGIITFSPHAYAAACAAPTTDRGSVTSTVSIPTNGTYRAWSRIMTGTASTDNSYLLEIDGNSCYTVGDNNAMPANAWTWVDYQSGTTTSKIDIALTAGTHTIKMIGREEGVKLDRVVFTGDTSCVPTGTGDNCASPPDAIAPNVSMTAPAANSTVSGNANLQATASDDSGTVSNVKYYLDGSATALATVTTSPYTYSWNSSTVADGVHTIVAKATDPSGNVGTSAAITVTANNSKPDLVITAISFSPAIPKAGDAVTFSATIKNQGTNATPAGTIHGVLFSVDGATVAWSDNSTTSLAAGASRTVTASSGPTGTATWAATSGTHTVLANVDDVNRIAESNESNNTLSVSLTPGANDTTAPTTAITSPTASAIIGGTTSVNASASDTVGVTKVEYYVDGSLVNTDTTSPYSYSWNTTSTTNGTHALTTKAYDAAGNIGPSAPVNVVVDNAIPTVTITAPANGATVSGIINVTSSAGDNTGVTKVDLYIDGNLGATDVAAPYTYSLDTGLLSNGTHTLTTKAYDAVGNSSTSAAVAITVSNASVVKSGDVNSDGTINIFDASILMGNWGKTGMSKSQGDLNADGTVNIFDASILMSNWGK